MLDKYSKTFSEASGPVESILGTLTMNLLGCYIIIISVCKKSETKQLFVNDYSHDSLFFSEGGRSKETD